MKKYKIVRTYDESTVRSNNNTETLRQALEEGYDIQLVTRGNSYNEYVLSMDVINMSGWVKVSDD